MICFVVSDYSKDFNNRTHMYLRLNHKILIKLTIFNFDKV